MGVLEALVAARSRRVGGDETAAGQGFGGRHAPTASSDELMVPPESSLSASVGEAERLIEQFVAQMEAEGIAGDEDDDIVMQRRKKVY